MELKISRLLIILSCLSLLASTAICWPREQGALVIGQPGEGISYGLITLHPTLDLTPQYDDNIFLSDGNREDDFLFVISPGLRLELPWDSNLFHFTYRADIYRYRDHQYLDDTNHFFEAGLDYYFYRHKLMLRDRYYRTFSRQRQEDIDIDRVRREENNATIILTQFFNRYSLSLGYNNYLERFLQEAYRPYNHQEHTGILRAKYKLTPKYSALLQYNYISINYREEKSARDAYANILWGGVEGQFTPKLSGIAKVGYQERDYRDPEQSDFGGMVASVLLTQTFSTYTHLDLGWKKTIRESTYTNSNYYKINRFWFRLGQQLNYRITAGLEGSYRDHSYPDISPGEQQRRHDDLWAIGCDLTYRIQSWLKVNLAYHHFYRDSNISGLDYYDDRIILKLSSYY